MNEVAMAARPAGEDGRVVEFGFDSRGRQVLNVGVPLSSRVGEGRRHRFALSGWCESCDGRFALLFTQHKGRTLVEVVITSPVYADDPQPLGELLPNVVAELERRATTRESP